MFNAKCKGHDVIRLKHLALFVECYFNLVTKSDLNFKFNDFIAYCVFEG